MKAIYYFNKQKFLLLLVVLLSSINLRAQTPVTAKVDAAGWKRVAYVNNTGGRGFGKISIFTSGGSQAPNYLDIEWFKDWLNTGGLTLKTNGGAGYWNGTRLTYDQDTTFIEVNFTTAIAGLQLLSDTYGWNVAKLYTGVLPNGSGTIRAEAKGGRLNIGDHLYVAHNGRVGIGTTAPKETLSVNGKIRAQEVKVETSNWPDYVFADGYQLPSLKETAKFIEKNKHLPGVPKAADIEENGLSLGEMNRVLMQKVEELTLHLIHKDNEMSIIKDELLNLKKQINEKD
ncbi:MULTISPECIES: hypothetical protein [Sphingobacterium]|uniref:hypothetical protein n=1 Tax=Sphingobacterium TaxID=28453 RepID=UPI00257E48A1|nr:MULTISPECIES: hypothetical protein [Sphingobacterium]